MRILVLAAVASLSFTPLALHADDISKVNGSVRVSAGTEVDDVSTVNGSIDIEDGVQAGNVETVNGSISLGRDVVVRSVDTVNGRVSFGEGARANAVETVNGAVTLASRTQVAGAVGTVNGSVKLERDASVTGDVTNVNGKISLDHAQVGGGLRTTSGDIHVGAGSRVQGGIFVEKPNSNWYSRSKRPPEIVIGAGAVVEGALEFEREVELYVHSTAKVGRIEGAKPVSFSGDEPGRDERRAAEKQLER